MKIIKNYLTFVWFLGLLCSPLFVPQIAGGEAPFGFVTVKVSVRHLLAVEISLAAVFEIIFPVAFAKEVVKVDGPVMVKVSKSSLNCRTSENENVLIFSFRYFNLLGKYCHCRGKLYKCILPFQNLLTQNKYCFQQGFGRI